MRRERIYINSIVNRGEEGSFISHIILEGLGSLSKESHEIVIEKLKGMGDKKYLEVELKLNGVRVKFKPFIKQLQSQHNRIVQDEAKQLVKQKLGKFGYNLSTLQKAIKRTSLTKLGAELTEEDYW